MSEAPHANRLARLAFTCLLLGSLLRPAAATAAPAPAAWTTPGPLTLPATGPTLPLAEICRGADAVSVAALDFLYFIPLISPEPVHRTLSAGSTQRLALTRLERSLAGDVFTMRCHFRLLGAGALQDDYDHAPLIRRNAARLRREGRLSRLLGYIRVEGDGDCLFEASGRIEAGKPVAQRAVLSFAGGRRPSPVCIGLQTVSGAPEAWQVTTEAVAYVAALTFVRAATPARMEVRLASLRHPEAAESAAERLKGLLKGALANWFIPPVDIEAAGNQAILDFAAALYAETPAFAFPLAPNLRSLSVGPRP